MKTEALQAFIAKGGAVSLRTGDALRTAPATSKVDQHRLGLAAQHLVAADILTRGYNCSISAEALPYDLIADINGLRRVQVKARAFAQYRTPKGKVPAYVFSQVYTDKADLFAFVAMPERLVFYRKASAIPATCFTILATEVDERESNRSWKDATEWWKRQK